MIREELKEVHSLLELQNDKLDRLFMLQGGA